MVRCWPGIFRTQHSFLNVLVQHFNAVVRTFYVKERNELLGASHGASLHRMGTSENTQVMADTLALRSSFVRPALISLIREQIPKWHEPCRCQPLASQRVECHSILEKAVQQGKRTRAAQPETSSVVKLRSQEGGKLVKKSSVTSKLRYCRPGTT